MSPMALCCLVAPAAPAPGDTGCQRAELFITDTADPLFEPQADATIASRGATVTGSTPLDGVYSANGAAGATVERSREFHLCIPDEPALHDAAEALRRQFHQEAVLTFDYRDRHAPGADAVDVEVPDVDVARFAAALAADPAARTHLGGGSVTTTDHTLILVCRTADLDIARRTVGAAGGDWTAAELAYGSSDLAE